jgi:hypothetical protein
MSSKNENTRCSGTTKKGEPCRAAATAGGLCFFHSNPNKASELGRKGGRSKRYTAAEMVDPLPILDNAHAIRDTLARLIDDVHTGKLQPRVAAGLAPLLTLQLRTIETVAKVEKVRAGTDLASMPLDDLNRDQLQQLLRDLEVEAKAIKASMAEDLLELSKSLLEIA